LARLFSPKDFGVLGAVLLIVSFGDIVWQAGIGPALIQRRGLTRGYVSTALVLSSALGLLVTLATAAISRPLSRLLGVSAMVLVVVSFSFIINGISAVPLALLQRQLRFGALLVKDIVESVSYAMVAVILGIMGFGVWALVAGVLARCGVGFLVVWRACPPGVRLRFSLSAALTILHFGSGVTLGRALNTLARNADNLVVLALMDKGSLGLYSRIYQIVTVPANITGKIVDQVFFPTVSTFQDNDERLGRVYVLACELLGFFYFPLAGLLFWLSRETVLVLLGRQWLDAERPLRALAAFMFFRAAYKVGEPLVRAKGRVFAGAALQLLYATSVFLCAFAGVSRGLVGVSFGVGCALVINFGVVSAFVYRLVRFPLSMFFLSLVRQVCIQFAAGGIVVLALRLVGDGYGLATFVRTVVVSLIGAAALWATWLSSSREMRVAARSGWRRSSRSRRSDAVS